MLERVDDLESMPNREANEDFENMWLSADEALLALTYEDTKDVLKKAIKIVESSKKL